MKKYITHQENHLINHFNMKRIWLFSAIAMFLFTQCQEKEHLVLIETEMGDMTVKLYYDKLLAAQYIDTADARVSAGLNLLVSKGLIEQARVAELASATQIIGV